MLSSTPHPEANHSLSGVLRPQLGLLSSLSVMFHSFATPWIAVHRLPCLSLSPWVCSNSCPSSQWYHPTITSSVTLFSSCPQFFPAPGLFQWVNSSHEVAKILASTSVLPMNVQDWFPLGLTGWISLQSKGLSRVFSNTTVQKHKFFCTQLSLYSNSHIHTWLMEK